MDFRVYGERLRQNGTAIHARESATVTLVKIKGDHIEFQLNGGGYGTFGDDTSTSVSMPNVGPSGRERELDRLIAAHGKPRAIGSRHGADQQRHPGLDRPDRRRLALIAPGRPVQNAFIESFYDRLREEFLNEMLFTSLAAARIALEEWRRDYNTVRPHSRIG